MSSSKHHPCPICSKSALRSERYPLAICEVCCSKACDAYGHRLSFYNVSIGGGFKAVLTETQEEYQSHTCYVDGVECRADEASFGGIVIEALKEPIRFYHINEPYGFFSNFALYPIFLKQKIWATSEHYFQAQKFANTSHEEEIRQAKTARESAEMGRDRCRPLRQDWGIVKNHVMKEALYAKFTQHPELTEKLLSTGDLRLIEHTKNDRYWGDGGDGTGLNMLGRLLMETRERIHYDLSNSKYDL